MTRVRIPAVSYTLHGHTGLFTADADASLGANDGNCLRWTGDPMTTATVDTYVDITFDTTAARRAHADLATSSLQLDVGLVKDYEVQAAVAVFDLLDETGTVISPPGEFEYTGSRLFIGATDNFDDLDAFVLRVWFENTGTVGGSFVLEPSAFDYAYLSVARPDAWPLHVVEPDGVWYRVGPNNNPDGGLLRLVEADGTRWVQGYDAATTDLGLFSYPPASWSFHTAPDGVWSDDGASSLEASGDGLAVRFTRPGELSVDDANDEGYVDVYYDPPTPPSPGAVCTGVAVWQDRTVPTYGVANWEFRDSTNSTMYASDSGTLATIFTTDPGEIADVAANGCIQRMHVEMVAALTEWDRLWLAVAWDGRAARPLSVVDSDGTVLTRLPMTLDSGGGGTWTADAAGVGWYADCGLFLGSAWTDLVGYPTALPAGAGELDYLVIDPAFTVDANPGGQPYADYYIYDDGGTPTNDFSKFGTVPNAGSKLWVMWFGPTYDNSVDAAPTVDPFSLVPAALAQFGTA